MRRREIGERLGDLARLVDRIDRSIEKIEVATIVREPGSAIGVDAYDGLRKQVIAATGERSAHLHQLAEFDSALRAGATADDLGRLVREWLGQAEVVLVDDPTVEGAFEIVGLDEGTSLRVRRPAYVDGKTGRVVRTGIAERVADEPDEPEEADDADEADEPVELEREESA